LKISDGSFRGVNVPLKEILAHAYDMPDIQHVILPANAVEARYDLILFQLSKEKNLQTLQKAIQTQLGITAQKETRQMDVTAIHLLKPDAPGLMPTKEKGIQQEVVYEEKGFRGTNLSFSDVIDQVIRKAVDGIVIDHTGLTGKYDMHVSFNRLGLKIGECSCNHRH
jgi:uncharacterized protein (TIGR03435 family)